MKMFKNEIKRAKDIAKYRIKCKCSHVVIMTNLDRKICTHCGNWIYKNKQIEFKYKMQEHLKKEKVMENVLYRNL